MTSTTAFRISAVFGFLAVALGAFGAHGLKEVLAHSLALLLVASREPLHVWAWRLFAAGIVVFSGSLYVLALTSVKVLGAITPIGGVCFLGGWLALAMKPK
jgi:uncharacterized membrane protein YgdD (TMEM256/DUF423 family)